MSVRKLALLSFLLLANGCSASGTATATGPSPSSATPYPSGLPTFPPDRIPSPSPSVTPSPGPTPVSTAGAVSLPSGVKYTILEAGPAGGATAKVADKVSFDYTGWLVNGTTFDSSIGKTPLHSTLSSQNLIQGMVLGMTGMAVGEKRRIVIPGDLGYGKAGQGNIPPNATLVFEVKLLAIGS